MTFPISRRMLGLLVTIIAGAIASHSGIDERGAREAGIEGLLAPILGIARRRARPREADSSRSGRSIRHARRYRKSFLARETWQSLRIRDTHRAWLWPSRAPSSRPRNRSPP